MLVYGEKTSEPSVEKITKLICILKIIISELENQYPKILFARVARLKDGSSSEIVAKTGTFSPIKRVYLQAKMTVGKVIKTKKKPLLNTFRKMLNALELLIKEPSIRLNQGDLYNMYTKTHDLLRDYGYDNLLENVQNEAIPQTNLSLEPRDNDQHNLTEPTNPDMHKELYPNIFKYVPLDQLPTVALVCKKWSNGVNMTAHWKIRLQRDFSLSTDKCDSIVFPQKVYRRLHLLGKQIKSVTRISDEHERSNNTLEFNSLNELLVFIKKDCFELSDYPEIFFPYSSASVDEQFLKKFQQSSRIWQRFILENAIVVGNFELIRFLVLKDKSLISRIIIAQACFSGDIQLIEYLSEGIVERDDLIWKMFSCKLDAITSFVTARGQNILNDFLGLFLSSAIEYNKQKIIAYLCTSHLSNFKSKCNEAKWNECKTEWLMAAINSNLPTQKILLQYLNLSVKDLPDDIFRYWITTPDIKKMLWLANERGIAIGNLASEILSISFWQDIGSTIKPELCQLFSFFIKSLRGITWELMAPKMHELLYVLFEVNNEVYPTESATLDPQFLFYFRCLFAIEADNAHLLHTLVLNDKLALVGDDLLTALCRQSQGRRKYHCLEYLLTHYSGISLSQKMFQSAFHCSDSVFFMMVKAAPVYSTILTNEFILNILLSHNYSYEFGAPPISLRFLKFIFETFKLNLPDDWESRLIATIPSHIRDYIREQVLEQKKLPAIMDVQAPPISSSLTELI